MNRKYNLRLDLQFRCNNSVMKFRQSDNKTSDFFMRITSGGELFDIDNAIVILAVIKPDQTVKSQILEVVDGKIYADLEGSMKDQVGIYKAQALLIYEDERVSTDIIEYEVAEDNILNQLEATVSTTEEFTMLQQMLSRLSTIEQQENQRELNESERIKSEEDRVAAEKERVKAEDIRNHEEADRSKYEATRQSNENKRIDSENIRISTENKRIYDESIRAANEESRIAAETERVNNYNFMTDDEERRRTEANSQAAAERLRVEAETERVNEEARRRTVEKSRVAAEQTREQNENTRVAAEKLRVEAEQTRSQEHITKMQSIDTTLKDLETTKTNLVKTVDDKVAEVNTKIQEVNKVSTDMQNTVNTKMQEVDAAEQQRVTDHQAREQFLNSFESQLAQIENKNIEQDTRLKDVENKNKVQDVYIGGLFNENKDGRLSVEGEGNDLKLEGSKQGLVEVDKVVGNTFVNIMSSDDESYNNDSNNINTDKWLLTNVKVGSSISNHIFTLIGKDTNILFKRKLDTMPLKPSTQYTLIVETLEAGYTGVGCTLGNTDKFKGQTLRNLFNTVGITKTLITTLDDFSSAQQDMYIYFSNVSTMDSVLKFKMYILEGDYTNKPIPSEYIEGIKSSFESNLVTEEMINEGLEDAENLGKYKVPVRIVGKNLFGGQLEMGDISDSTGKYQSYPADVVRCVTPIKIKPNTKYVFNRSFTVAPTFTVTYFYDKDMKLIKAQNMSEVNISPSNACYMSFKIQNANNITSLIQLEEGTVATDYEEYFERTTNAYLNSPLLEGDEIVMKDGELYHYHNSYKEVFDGSDDEGWVVNSTARANTIAFQKWLDDGVSNTTPICDKFSALSSLTVFDDNAENIKISYTDKVLFINIFRSKLSTQDLQGFKAWLQSNPTTVIYPLAEPWYEPIQTDKLLLECANDSTIHIESIVPVKSVKASYTTGIPNAYLLQETNDNQDDLINISLCATDEMYMMIEPLLEVVPQTLNNERMISKMVDMYVAMVIRGLKTIDEVPVRYRKEVQTILDKLEK